MGLILINIIIIFFLDQSQGKDRINYPNCTRAKVDADGISGQRSEYQSNRTPLVVDLS